MWDILIIGGGPGGYVCALRAAQLGFKVACVEKKDLGGTCLNVGCIPSKALLESTHFIHSLAHTAPLHGVQIPSVSWDLSKIMSRKNQIVKDMNGGIQYLFKKAGVTLIKGQARLLKNRQVLVGEDIHEAQRIVLGTGSLPSPLPGAPFDGKHVVSSTEALSWQEPPKDLLVIGAGAIGLEMGSVWQRLGTKVTLWEFQNQILGNSDRQAARDLQKELENQGLTFHLQTRFQNLKISQDDSFVEAYGEKNGDPLFWKGDKVLVATGRRANTEGLWEEGQGPKLGKRGEILVNDQGETSLPGVYALGDLTQGPMLAHKAQEEGYRLAEKFQGISTLPQGPIPSVVYTHPELASVGLTEEECQELPFKKGFFPLKANGRAKAMGAQGWVKILAHEKTHEILGIHILAPHASELISEASLALAYKARTEDIALTTHPHPTLSEALKEAALSADGLALHL